MPRIRIAVTGRNGQVVRSLVERAAPPDVDVTCIGRPALDLGNPDIGWVKLAESLGVEAAAADTLETLGDLMARSFQRPGPFLIELAI